MQIITNTIIDDKDLILLKDTCDVSPCKTCAVRNSQCVGCPAQREYEKSIQKYKQANLWDLKSRLIDISTILLEIDRLKRLVDTQLNALPDIVTMGLSIRDIFRITALISYPQYMDHVFATKQGASALCDADMEQSMRNTEKDHKGVYCI